MKKAAGGLFWSMQNGKIVGAHSTPEELMTILEGWF